MNAERAKLSNVLVQRFPNYVALAKPQALTLQETQNLLANDEAIVAFDVGVTNSYGWVVTKTEGFWTEIAATSKTLNEQAQQLRQSLTFNTDKPFEVALAQRIYEEIFGCPFRKSYPARIRVVRQNHRIIESDVCNAARAGNVRRRPVQGAEPA